MNGRIETVGPMVFLPAKHAAFSLDEVAEGETLAQRIQACWNCFEGVPLADIQELAAERVKAREPVLTPELKAEAVAFARATGFDSNSIDQPEAP